MEESAPRESIRALGVTHHAPHSEVPVPERWERARYLQEGTGHPSLAPDPTATSPWSRRHGPPAADGDRPSGPPRSVDSRREPALSALVDSPTVAAAQAGGCAQARDRVAVGRDHCTDAEGDDHRSWAVQERSPNMHHRPQRRGRARRQGLPGLCSHMSPIG